MKSGIYLFRCGINGKVYIGQAQDLKRREKEHRRKLTDGTSHNKHLLAAWFKYGEQNFIYGIIEYCSVEDLDNREQYWLDHYKAYDRRYGYNHAKDAKAFHRGMRHSEVTRKKISQSHKGMKYSEEYRAKMKIIKNSPEHQARIKQTRSNPEWIAAWTARVEKRRKIRNRKKLERKLERLDALADSRQLKEAERKARREKNERRMNGTWSPEEKAEWGCLIKERKNKKKRELLASLTLPP